MKLDQYQKNVVLDNSKYILVVAGAGSGKTTTIIKKIKYLIDELNVDSNKILLLSFGHKNKIEMDCRLKELNINTNVYTFHQLGLKFLDNVHIINENLKKQVIYELICKNINKFSLIFYFLFNNTKLVLTKRKLKFMILDLVNDCITYINYIKLYGTRKIKFKKLFNTIYREYENYLESNNLIEFEDIITKSTSLIKNINYEYIIVDEYQDISKNRFFFLKKLIDYTNACFLGVGDDFQSIYGFSGSRIKYFTNLDEYLPNLKVLKLINTYRNSQELINIAGNFILKNNKQIKKSLISNKHINSPIILIDDRVEEFIKILNTFNNKTIGILSRYSFDLYKYSNLFKKESEYYIYHDLKLYFTTIHKSKGLEYDEVIILNLNKGIYGFPSNKKNKRIFKSYESNNYFEERRLFYVALTRTRNRVYIMSGKRKSPFIKEIKKEINKSLYKS